MKMFSFLTPLCQHCIHCKKNAIRGKWLLVFNIHNSITGCRPINSVRNRFEHCLFLPIYVFFHCEFEDTEFSDCYVDFLLSFYITMEMRSFEKHKEIFGWFPFVERWIPRNPPPLKKKGEINSIVENDCPMSEVESILIAFRSIKLNLKAFVIEFRKMYVLKEKNHNDK